MGVRPYEYPGGVFPVVDGSMTSEDGQTFLYHVRREDGSKLMLGFPHIELPNLFEYAAIQMDKGRDANGDKIITAFNTSSFRIGMDQNGRTVLTFTVGGSTELNFLLRGDVKRQIFDALGKLKVTD